MSEIVYIRIAKSNTKVCKIGSTRNIVNRMMSVKTEMPKFDDTTHYLCYFAFDFKGISCYDIDQIIKDMSTNYGKPLKKYSDTGGTEFYNVVKEVDAVYAVSTILNTLNINYTFVQVDINELFTTDKYAIKPQHETKNKLKLPKRTKDVPNPNFNKYYDTVVNKLVGKVKKIVKKTTKKIVKKKVIKKNVEKIKQKPTILRTKTPSTPIIIDPKDDATAGPSQPTSKTHTQAIPKSKYNLIYGPCQSGKTFKLIEKIGIDKSKYADIVIVDNSLSQLKQTQSRMSEHYTCINISSKSKYDADDAISLIKSDNRIVILVCGNIVQLRNINRIVSNTECNYRLWLDEADKVSNPNSIYRMVNILNDRDNVKMITFITATPDRIRKKYTLNDNMKLNALPTYTSLKKHKFITKYPDLSNKNNAYISDFIRRLNGNNRTKGQIWFIPSGRLNRQHDDLANKLNNIGMCTFIINMRGVTLVKDGVGSVYSVTANGTLTNTIDAIYKTNKLHNYNVAVTGLLCIGRGITLMSKDFIFTHAILPNVKNSDNMYQLAGRLCGNVNNGKRTVIYCSKSVKKRVLMYEHDVTS